MPLNEENAIEQVDHLNTENCLRVQSLIDFLNRQLSEEGENELKLFCKPIPEDYKIKSALSYLETRDTPEWAFDSVETFSPSSYIHRLLVFVGLRLNAFLLCYRNRMNQITQDNGKIYSIWDVVQTEIRKVNYQRIDQNYKAMSTGNSTGKNSFLVAAILLQLYHLKLIAKTAKIVLYNALKR